MATAEPRRLAEPEETSAPAFADDGTDLTVIRWMLALSVEERLAWLQTHMQAVAALRRDETHT